MRAAVAIVLLAVAACARPPASSYLADGGADAPAAVAIGRNAVGEACTLQPTEGGGGDLYCGTWQQPSARLRPGGSAGSADLAAIAATGPWRAGIDARLSCEPPQPTTILGGDPAQLLACTARRGGWPHAALVAQAGGRVWYADGVLAAAAVMERAIGVRAGVLREDAPAPSSDADALLARRLAAQAVSSGDIGQYEALMAAGTRANLAGTDAAAEAAFRAALLLQQQALGAADANTATTVMTLALQLSDEGRAAEAGRLFDRAAALAGHAADPLAPARLLHYRGLDAANRGADAEALALLDEAAAGYLANLPPDARAGAAQAAPDARAGAAQAGAPDGFARAGAALIPNQGLLVDPAAAAALVGLVEVRRNQGLILRRQGRLAESRAALAAAASLAGANGLARPILAARLYRSAGVTAADAGETAQALSDLAAAGRDFGRALPRSRPFAETALLHAGELRRAGQAPAALLLCRDAVAGLRALAAGAAPALLAPCLDAFGEEAARLPEGAGRQAVLAELVAAAQLAQGGVTSRQIAQATARLAENARDPRVAAAIRRRDEAAAALQALYRRRDEGAAPAAGETEIRAATAALAEADAAVQAASPNFGQLVQPVVAADAILAALAPQEALAAIVPGPADGWVLLLHDGRIDAGRMPLGEAAIARLVARLRASVEQPAMPADFDAAAAQELYRVTLGPVAPALAGVARLVVAPGGPLLALPFGVLLTGPADPARPADAPWLLRRLTVVHVPSPGNFVSLRRIAGRSRAERPWFGFGAPVPLTAAEAGASFPSGACGDSARRLADLPPLPGARRELAAARALFGAAGAEMLLGAAFTAPAVLAAPLKQYRVLHFATHALLPAELRCLDQPAIVASAPAGAPDAAGALLTAAQVTGLDLDAELVILSACNTGGADGGAAGESLSGLARAFFYAGARTLLVTHWPVNDEVAAYLVADTLARLRAAPALGAAGALRAAQLALLGGAGHDLPAAVAHPFFWAGFAAIGEGGGGPAAQASRASPAGL